MVDADKKQFWAMLNVTMELCNRPPLSKEAVISWWNLLSKYELSVVRKSLDAWVDENQKAPSPSDIKSLCKPLPEFYKAIGHVRDSEKDKAGLKKIDQFVAANIESKRDYKAWAKRILANPKNYPAKSVQYAKEALGMTA